MIWDEAFHQAYSHTASLAILGLSWNRNDDVAFLDWSMTVKATSL